jgi:hypothetical protein
LEKVIFAKGFDGTITDIETGLDGNLYILYLLAQIKEQGL